MFRNSKQDYRRLTYILMSIVLLSFLYAGSTIAQTAPITRDEIIKTAKTGVGHGYKWGGAAWIGFDKYGWCYRSPCQNPNECFCSKRAKKTNKCETYYTVDAPGADCAGYVSTCWGLTHWASKRFYNNRDSWNTINKSDLKRGDALVYWNSTRKSGHIVLFDEKISSSEYYAYEAKGCNFGIDRFIRKYANDNKYISIRRDKITEPVCNADSCNDHGTCNAGVCVCDMGYDGLDCDHCEEGFSGYPTCRRSDSPCVPFGTIACNMKPVDIRPQEGSNTMEDYSCEMAGQGEEMVYRFLPRGTGRATIDLVGSSSGMKLGLLRGACDPDGCVAADNEQLDFEFTNNDMFYVVVESGSRTDDVASLFVNCTYDEKRFIGDPCNDNEDCNFAEKGQQGYCYRTETGGMCTIPCTDTCPEYDTSLPQDPSCNQTCRDKARRKAKTFCIADPNNSNKGICVSESEALNSYCAELPGTESVSKQRFNNNSLSKTVCSPTGNLEVCTGSFEGRVVEYESNVPIDGADILVYGDETLIINSDSNGVYSMNNLPCGKYALEIGAIGYLSETVVAQVDQDESTKITSLRVLPTSGCPDSSRLQGFVFKSTSPTRSPIGDAMIEVWPGLSSEPDGPVTQTRSGQDGLFDIVDLTPGNYSVRVTADDYIETLTTSVVCGESDDDHLEVALTPAKKDQDTPFRIVLSWDQPSDLDLHVQTPQGEEIYYYTPCRGNYSVAPYVYLDVDRRDADGPEVMSFKSFLPGRYTVYVHNYSADAGDEAVELKDSNAEVLVYAVGGKTLLRRFPVPTTGYGIAWDVFSFDGSRFDGKDATKIESIQKIVDRPDPETEYRYDCRP